MKFQFEVPNEVADACRFLATQPDFFSQSPRNIVITLIMQAEKKFRQDISATSKKGNAASIEAVIKNIPETHSISTQPVYKQPATPESIAAFEADMAKLLV